jgi:hypothetical protein
MSTIAISSLPVVTSGTATDVFPIVQNNVTSQITNADLFNSVTNLTVANAASLQGVIVGGSGTNNYVIGSIENLSVNTGTDNLTFGTYVLSANTTGVQNVGIGTLALNVNLTGDSNLAIGYVAQRLRTSGSYNVGLGDNALAKDVSSSFNTAVGAVALLNATTGSNTAVGYRSGYLITTGTKNTILGRYTGNQGGLDIRLLSNYIVLSDGDGNPRAYWNAADATFGGALTTTGAITTTSLTTSTFKAMSGGVNTIASASGIGPVKEITYISGTAAIATISPQPPLTANNGTIILIPTGVFTWTTADNIAVAGTAVVGRALHMTYVSSNAKWYPSYV